MSKGKIVIGVLAGVAVGALMGILFAPDKGTETRKKNAKKSCDTIDDLKGKCEDIIADASDKLEEVKAEAQHCYEKSKSLIS